MLRILAQREEKQDEDARGLVDDVAELLRVLRNDNKVLRLRCGAERELLRLEPDLDLLLLSAAALVALCEPLLESVRSRRAGAQCRLLP